MQNISEVVLKWVAGIFAIGLIASEMLDWSWMPDWMPGSIVFLLVLFIGALVLGAITGKLADITKQLGEAAKEQPIKGILLFAVFSGIYVGIMGVGFFWGVPFLQELTLLPYRWTWVLGIVLSLLAIPPLVLAYKMVGIPWEEKILRRATQTLALLIIIAFAITVFENPTKGFSISGDPLYMVAEEEGRIYPIRPENCTAQNPCYSPATREKLRPATPTDIERYGTNPHIITGFKDMFSGIEMTVPEDWRRVFQENRGFFLFLGAFLVIAVLLTRGMKGLDRFKGIGLLAFIVVFWAGVYQFVTWDPGAETASQTPSKEPTRTTPQQSSWTYTMHGHGQSRVKSFDITDDGGLDIVVYDQRGTFVMRGERTSENCGEGVWKHNKYRHAEDAGRFRYCFRPGEKIQGKIGDGAGNKATFTLTRS